MITRTRTRTYSAKSHRGAPIGEREYAILCDLGQRVSARRRNLKLSFRAASPTIGISASTLSRVEKGDIPSAAVLLRMLRYLDIDVAALARQHEPLPTDE